MTKTPVIILLLTVALTGLLLICLVRPAPPAAAGEPHPEIPEMNRGGDGDRHAGLILVGGLYGGLQIVLLISAMRLGIRRDHNRPLSLLIAGTVYVGTFAAMVVTYTGGMERAPEVLGLPLPTSLMVFGMWGVPFVFVVLYIAKFREWIYSEDDARRFADLVARRDESPGSHPDG